MAARKLMARVTALVFLALGCGSGLSCVGDDSDEGRDAEPAARGREALVECRSGVVTAWWDAAASNGDFDAETFTPAARLTLPETFSGTNLLDDVDYVLAFGDGAVGEMQRMTWCVYTCTPAQCPGGEVHFDQCYEVIAGEEGAVALEVQPGDAVWATTTFVGLFVDHIPANHPLITLSADYQEAEPCSIHCDGLDDSNDCTIDRCVEDGLGGLVAAHTNTCDADLDAGAATTVGAMLEVLESEGIIDGVDLDALDQGRLAGVTGRVVYPHGGPATGVSVRIVGHPQYGSTVTDANGEYVLAVEGGSRFTVGIDTPGYLPVHRQVLPSWQGWARADEAMLTLYDPEGTEITLGSGAMQVHRASTSTDGEGSRRPTLLIPAGVTANVELASGGTTPLPTMTLRVSEYTVGDDGPRRMPAPLPPSTAYTYAAEISADEVAGIPGATGVALSAPLFFYMENHLGMPIGARVPSGRYDRQKVTWVAQDDGRVVRIVSRSGTPALANVDTDGVAGADNTGLSTSERQELAAFYADGAELWRMPIDHFTPHDFNFPNFPDGCLGSNCDDLPAPDDDDDDDDSCEYEGSIIECTNQVVGQRVPLVGTGMTLNYRSNRVPGYVAARHVRAPLTGPALNGLLAAEVSMDVAGRHIVERIDCLTETCTPNMLRTLAWDGKDRFGRFIQGRTNATITTRLEFPVAWGANGAAIARSFAQATPPYLNQIASLYSRRTREKRWNLTIGSWDARSFGLGGWTLDEVHVYNPITRVLTLGNGRRRTVDGVGATVRDAWTDTAPTLAVHNHDAFSFGGQNGVNLFRRNLDDPSATPTVVASLPTLPGVTSWANQAIELSPEGVIHLLRFGDGAPMIFRLDGTSWTHVAGTTGANVDTGDGGVATLARIARHPAAGTRMAVGRDGSVFVSGLNVIRRISPDGLIERYAGTGINGSEQGSPARGKKIGQVTSIDVAPDGHVYFGHAGNPGANQFNSNNFVGQVDPDGTLRTLAGGGTAGPSYQASTPLAGSGTAFYPIWGLEAPTSQRLLLASQRYGWTGTITQTVGAAEQGRLAVLAGASASCGTFSCGDGGLAPRATFTDYLWTPRQRSDGSIVLSGWHQGTSIISPALPGMGGGDLLIPSEDAREVYRFDAGGRHLETLDAETNLRLYSVEYDTQGRIDYVTDWRGVDDGALPTGRVTDIAHAGNTVTVTGPDLHVTTIILDANGWASLIHPPDAPAGEGYAASYGTGAAAGLLTTFRKPESTAASTFTYDAAGRLTTDTDPNADATTLTRTDTPTGWKVELARPSGLVTTNEIERPTTGERDRIVKRPGLTEERKTVRRPDGVSMTTTEDGTTIERTLSPDPRWGMLAPYVAKEVTTVPTVPPRTIYRNRTVSSAASPLAFGTLTENTWVNPSLTGGVPSGTAPKTTRTFVQSSMQETVTTPEGDATTRVLDAFGRTLERTPPGASELSFTYDAHGRMLTSSQGAGAATRTTTRSYVGRTDGQLDTLLDAENQLSVFDWDAAGRLVEIQRPDAELIGFAFDTNGNLDAVTPPDQPAHLFGQDDLDQVTLYDPPGSSTFDTIYTFDGDRRLDSETRPGSITLDYQYDATTGLLSGVVKSNDEKITLGYDSSGRLSARRGPIFSFGIATQALNYTYQGGLVVKEALAGNAGAVKGDVEWTYNSRLLPATETVTPRPGQGSPQAISFVYDDDGLLTTAGELTIGRGDGGRIVSIANTHASQTILETRDYDAFGALEHILVTHGTGTLFEETINARDKLGRITERTESISGGPADVYEYEYDLAGRLWRVWKNAVEVEEYAYDPNGNRTSAQYDGGTPRVASTADTQDRIATYGPYGFSYSSNGTLTARSGPTGLTTTYNVFGDLTSHRYGTQTRNFIADARHRRIRQSLGTTFEAAWLWRSDLQPVAQLTSTGAIEQRYVYADAPNVPELVITSTGERWRVIKDHLGSARMVVNTSDGAVKRQTTFDAFGRITASSGPLPAAVPFGFAGGLHRPELQLVRFGARDYDPEIGRWTSKDPIRFEGGDSNIYAYVGNDPVNAIDPDGRLPRESHEMDTSRFCFDACVSNIDDIEKSFAYCNRERARCERARQGCSDDCDEMWEQCMQDAMAINWGRIQHCKDKCGPDWWK